jgi:hypothetical protein
MQPAIITASATVIVAVLAFLLNQYSQARMERRQGYLARVNQQLRDLYGPLSALVDVNERIWDALRANGLPPASERNAESFSQGWAVWRDSVLMPTNIRIRDLIVSNADLLVGVDFPAPLRDFCAHVGSYEVTLAEAVTARRRPDVGIPVHIGHPGSDFVDYVRDSFLRLKEEQRRLLSARDS